MYNSVDMGLEVLASSLFTATDGIPNQVHAREQILSYGVSLYQFPREWICDRIRMHFGMSSMGFRNDRRVKYTTTSILPHHESCVS